MPTPILPLFSSDTPLIFADGTKVFDDLAKKYRRHDKGLFIMAPSGAGKTHFVENQKDPHWIDGDILWMRAKAHPKGAWWLEPIEVITAIDARCDVITAEAKKQGFWVVGASNAWLKPDAIVIPHWSTHRRWIKVREQTAYDGGATSDQLQGVLHHRRWIAHWTKKGVPKFKTVAEAAAYLVAQ